MLLLPPPPPQWVLDINSEPITKPKSTGIPDPPGYISNVSKVCQFHNLRATVEITDKQW